jgi:hypothetical protein
MKRIRLTEEQIIGVLREAEAGAKTADLARRHGVSEATLYNWKASTAVLGVGSEAVAGAGGRERATQAAAGGWPRAGRHEGHANLLSRGPSLCISRLANRRRGHQLARKSGDETRLQVQFVFYRCGHGPGYRHVLAAHPI